MPPNRSSVTAIMLTTALAFVAFHAPGAVADDGTSSGSGGAAEPSAPRDRFGSGAFNVTGVVVDGETGAPVVGAGVWAWTEPTEKGVEPSKGEATTDVEGRYVLRLNAGYARLGVSADGYERAEHELKVAGNTSHDVKLKPLPPRDAAVTGRVVDADGNPVPGARVTLQTRWEDVPAREEHAGASGGDAGTATTTGSRPSSADGERTEGCTPQECGENVTAKSDVRILPMPEGRYEWQETTTDESGAYRFDAYPGPRVVQVMAKGFAQGERKVDLVKGENRVDDIVLERVPATDAVIQGRVVDAETGLPVTGARVNVHNLAWNRWNGTTTGADGTFRVETLPGYTRVDVHAQGRGYRVEPDSEGGDATTLARSTSATSTRDYYPWQGSIVLESGENAFTAKLAPKPAPSLVVQGYVVEADSDEAVPGAWVSIRNADTGEWGHAITDRFGSFKFVVRPGYIVLEAGAQGHFANSLTLRLRDGDKLTRADVTIPQGESKWAPCWDECYATYDTADLREKGRASVAADGDAAGGTSATFDESARAANAPPEGGDEAAYAGTGGGLGPYKAATESTREHAAPPHAPTPAEGAAVALAVLGAAALAVTRRGPGRR